jgi:exonuclease III
MTANRSDGGFRDGSASRARARIGVLTWNVQHASPGRVVRQAAWLADCPAADIITLTEVPGGPAGDRLSDALVGHGYTTYLTDGNGDYRVLLASRVGRLEPNPRVRLDYLPHRLAAATVTVGTCRLGLVGLYVPSRGPRSRRNLAKRAFQTAVTARLPQIQTAFGATVPVVVAGDLNVVEPEHTPRHRVFGQWEYEFYRSFAAAGFTDAFRHRCPDVIDHSWYGRSGAGYRFDHLFATTEQVDSIVDCRYMHQFRTDGLSDHAALAAVFVAADTVA